jgi:hypothetical protein
MNCTDVRARLPGLLYGDLPAGQADDVRSHLARCPSCAAEHAALAEVRRLLDTAPAPAAVVDLARLYREAAERQARRLRRWRRVAVGALAVAAAVVLVVLLSRLEVRVESHQVVVRWGEMTAPEAPAPPAPKPLSEELPVVVVTPPPSAEVEQQLRLLSELVQTLSSDADARNGRRQEEIAEVRAQVQALRQQMAQLRLATEQDVSVLYNAQFPDREKGAQR